MKKYINKLELKNGIKVLKGNVKLGILTSSFVLVSLTGCGESDYSKYVRPATTESTTEMTTEVTTESTTEVITTTESTTEATTEHIEPTTEDTIEETNEIVSENTSEEKSKDEIITEFFATQKEELQQYIDSNDVENIKAKGKDIFTTFVDFIFYDGEIYGIKYDELSDGIKEQLYTDFCNIDSLVSSYDSNYKEDLADKYYKVKDFVSPYYYSTTDKIKEYIGTDNMEKLNDIKENTSDVTEDLWNKSKEKIKNAYEEWKDE